MSKEGQMTPPEQHEPMTVNRVYTERGSHIEPPLNQRWSNLDKLRWQAGVVEADTGIQALIVTGCYVVRRFGRDWTPPDSYGVSINNSQWSVFRYKEAWDFLTGVQAGAEATKPPPDLVGWCLRCDELGEAGDIEGKLRHHQQDHGAA